MDGTGDDENRLAHAKNVLVDMFPNVGLLGRVVKGGGTLVYV